MYRNSPYLSTAHRLIKPLLWQYECKYVYFQIANSVSNMSKHCRTKSPLWNHWQWKSAHVRVFVSSVVIQVCLCSRTNLQSPILCCPDHAWSCMVVWPDSYHHQACQWMQPQRSILQSDHACTCTVHSLFSFFFFFVNPFSSTIHCLTSAWLWLIKIFVLVNKCTSSKWNN